MAGVLGQEKFDTSASLFDRPAVAPIDPSTGRFYSSPFGQGSTARFGEGIRNVPNVLPTPQELAKRLSNYYFSTTPTTPTPQLPTNASPRKPLTGEQLDPGYRANLPTTGDGALPQWLRDLFGGGDTGQVGSGSGGGGGVSFQPLRAPAAATFTPAVIDRSLYQFEETAAEAQALADARADLDARARAGAQSIMNSWQAVETNNRAAAEKARALAEQYGADAGGLWVNAANQAREASVLRAAAAMANAGRAPIDLDPLAGGGAFIAAMESLAMPESRRAIAEGEMQAERADWAANMAQAQSAAYQGELKRTSMIMAADMAREHNARVLDRIGRERLALSEAERQTDMFNRQLQSQIERENIERAFATDQFNAQQRQAASQFNAQLRASQAAANRSTAAGSNDLLQSALRAAALNDPSLLVAEFGMTPSQAALYVSNIRTGSSLKDALNKIG
jgi:hypothetical protein